MLSVSKFETPDSRNGSLDVVSVSDSNSLFSEPSDTGGEAGAASSARVGEVGVLEDFA